VDHVQNYKVPKVFDADGNEIEPDEDTVNNAAPKPIQGTQLNSNASSTNCLRKKNVLYIYGIVHYFFFFLIINDT
jgi:hypothetical protein